MNKEDIINILKTVKYPGFSRDIVSFGLLQNVELNDSLAKVVLELTTSDSSLAKTLKESVEKILLEKTNVEKVEVLVRLKTENNSTDTGEKEKPSENLSGITRIIAVASGKGGVGKSTLTANLACALTRVDSSNGNNLRVGIMDCDLYGPSIPQVLGVAERPQLVGDNILAPVESFGVKCISMGLLIDEESPVVWRGPMIMKTIQQFAHNVQWGELDYLLIDLPPGTGDAQLSLAQILPLDGALIITTPQKAAVDVARRGARMFEKVNVPILGVVENMSYQMNNGEKFHLFGKGGGASTAKALECPFLGEIPLHEEVRLGGDHGTPVVITNPENISSLGFASIAEKVVKLL
jgi:ATP-binding protein involved in chromosome partitioning